MKKLFVLVMAVLVVMAFAAGVMAGGDIAAAVAPDASGGLTDKLEPIVASLVGTIVSTAVAYLSLMLKKKWGLEIGAETQRRISAVAFDAVHVVEEQAAAHLKEKEEKWLSTSKHQAAISYVLSKIPTLSKDEADEKVTAALAMIKGMGATGNRVGV